MNQQDSRAARWAMVAAFRWEVSALLRKQQIVRKVGDGRFRFSLQGEPVVLAIAGAGSENAYRAACGLIRDFSVAGLVSVGFAGGLGDALAIGDLLVAEEVIEENSGARFICDRSLLPLKFGLRGRLLSAAAVVTASEAKQALAKRWDALAVDMESSGVARASKERGLPFGAVKCITDPADQCIAIDFHRCRSEDGGLSNWRIVREGLASPGGVRDLWRLAGSSRRAASKLALALCSF